MRILLVENHPDTLVYIDRYLRKSGHEVRTAQSIAEARAELQQSPCDLLLSDLGLSDGDGWELLESLGPNRPPHAVAMSGKNDPADRARSFAIGFKYHLCKPFPPEELDAALAACAADERE